MSDATRFCAAAVALMIGFVGFWFLLPKTTTFGMFADEGNINWGRILLSFSATVVGVVLGSFYRQLRQLQLGGNEVVPHAFVPKMLRSIDMWLGLVSAPIVYALLLQSTAGMALPGLLLVALENGFCCLVIVNGFTGEMEARAQGDRKPPGSALSGS